jgi:hypothetical protein
MATALAGARQSVAAPARTARRFGLLSVAEVVSGGDTHWMLGGLTADGEECSEPLEGDIPCGPSTAKTSRSWYSDLESDPWLAYMYETCKTVGRVNESQAKLRTRFAAAEQSAVEIGFQKHVLLGAYSWGEQPSIPAAIGRLEQEAGEAYGGQIIIHLPFIAAEVASSQGAFERVDGHLETVAGSRVSIGNYSVSEDGGTQDVPVLYATGAVTLYQGNLVETGPVIGYGAGGAGTNDYYVLAERGYAALVDCFLASATAPLCPCGA